VIPPSHLLFSLQQILSPRVAASLDSRCSNYFLFSPDSLSSEGSQFRLSDRSAVNS
jgi:hypothetical protein